MNNKIIKTTLSVLLSTAMTVGLSACTSSTPTETPEPVIDETAFYVATNGNDENAGTKDAPFLTLTKAMKEVENVVAAGLTKPVTVYVRGGDYSFDGMELTEKLSGTKEYPVKVKAYKDERVILNGGKTLKNADFKPVTDEKILARLADGVKDKIRVIDLKAYGLKHEDIGDIYAVGSADTSGSYGAKSGSTAELFWNEKRLTMARYPDTGYLRVDGIVDAGDSSQLIPATTLVDSDTASRMARWQELDKAWVFARWMYQWADMTTPVAKYDSATRELTCSYYSSFGYSEAWAQYYFFNVLEELDAPGEYYIDRENMLIYVYPPENEEDADGLISVNTNLMISGNVSNFIFENIDFMGQRGNGLNLHGDNIKLLGCKFACLAGDAAELTGSDDIIYNCEACALGMSGFRVTGGDVNTLTPGNSAIENCYVHHFSEVYRSYRCALVVAGCGNKVIHNEVAYAPHVAISYAGNENLIEYNYIHDVVLDSSDAGALYVGGIWTSCGNRITHNLFKDIGSKGTDCKAIYLDDGNSSAIVIGNIIDGCSGDAIMIGGGRDVTVLNNLVISDSNPLYYDCRMGTSVSPEVNWASIYWHTKPGEGLWRCLEDVPYLSDIWREKYPNVALITKDYSRYRDPEFPGNPAYSVVKNNIFIGKIASAYQEKIDLDVFEYSEIGYNVTTAKRKDLLETDTYNVKDSISMYEALYGFEWEQIPYEQIGRYDIGIK